MIDVRGPWYPAVMTLLTLVFGAGLWAAVFVGGALARILRGADPRAVVPAWALSLLRWVLR